jgi:sugar phosphate isomerase/epimerase
LRFGIQPFELTTIGGLVSEKGAFDLTRLDVPSIVRRCIKEGFQVIELGLDLGYVIPGSINAKAVDELMKIKNSENISYTVHLPLWSVEPASPNEFIRKASIEVLADAVKLSEPLNPEAYVVHATGALAAEFSRLEFAEFYKDYIARQMTSLAEQSIKGLLDSTSVQPEKLAVETVEFPYRYMKKLIEKHDVSVCCDVGHIVAGYPGKYTVLGFLEEFFDKIIDIHLHDAYQMEKEGVRIQKDHLPLGQGGLPVRDFLDFLYRHEYSRPIVFELTLPQALQSLQVIREKYPKALEKSGSK